jgi:cytochrome oxidase assembly protein ShyY1
MTAARVRAAARLALTPRWLVGLLVLVLLTVLAIQLGRWQWDRTQSILAAERAAVSQPIPVEVVFADGDQPPVEIPPEGIGRPVTATGEFDPAWQTAVTNRELDGQPGVWLVTGMRVDDGQSVAVLRGWLPDATDAGAAVPDGLVTVAGVLQPSEAFYADAGATNGTVVAISHETLADLWGTPLLPGFIVLQQQDPTSSPAPSPVPPTVQTADVPFPLQNFFYAFQWWIFAAFGLAVYLRYLWVESGRQPEDTSEPIAN